MSADGCPRATRRARFARAVCLVGAMSLPAGARAQYLAVFVDGRILHVAGARVLDARRIRFEMPGGGTMEVPLRRVDRVIEDAVEGTPTPVETTRCAPGWVDQPLPPATPYRVEIEKASKESNLHPWLVAAVVEAESRFNRWAVSRVGAAGLMQLMPSVWLAERLRDPYDPRANVRAGCRHLRALLDRFQQLGPALAAYNAGAAVVDASGGIPAYRETREYVRRVLRSFCPDSKQPASTPRTPPAK